MKIKIIVISVVLVVVAIIIIAIVFSVKNAIKWFVNNKDFFSL